MTSRTLYISIAEAWPTQNPRDLKAQYNLTANRTVTATLFSSTPQVSSINRADAQDSRHESSVCRCSG